MVIQKEKIDNSLDINSESEDSVSFESASDDDEDKYLTAQEKKVKLAEKYLRLVQDEENQKAESEETSKAHILGRLKEDVLKKTGNFKQKLADQVRLESDKQTCLRCKQHKLSITCVWVSRDNQYLYSSSKDYSIVKWSLNDFQKSNYLSLKRQKSETGYNERYHNTLINCLVTSRDDSYLISGDAKGRVNVWRADNLDYVRSLEGHKKSISSLTVCRETNSLYSASADSQIKVWNLDEFAYVETLFGHQSGVTSVDVLAKDRVVSSGGTDRTLRVWKVQEESQLIYQGLAGSIDVVRKLDDGFFVSVGDDGNLCLWGVLKKKPLHVVANAHGICSSNGEPNWITALAVLPNSDLIATGSDDGYIRLWKWSASLKTIASLSSYPVVGFVNEIHFTWDKKYLIAAISKEHRLGRWKCIKEAKNQIIVLPLTSIS